MDKKKVLLVGVDHGIWEDHFNAHIEGAWTDRFYMYNESLDPERYYKKVHIAGITEDPLLHGLSLILTIIVATTHEDIQVIVDRFSAHGYRKIEGLSQFGMITKFLVGSTFLFLDYIRALEKFEETHDLGGCASERLQSIYRRELVEGRGTVYHTIINKVFVDLPAYTEAQMREVFNYYRYKTLLGAMIVVEALSELDTELGQQVREIFGGIDFTTLGTDATNVDIESLARDLTYKVRDRAVFELVIHIVIEQRLARLERTVVTKDIDAIVLVVGGGHVNSLENWFSLSEDILLLKSVTFNQDVVADLEGSSLEEIMIDKMNEIREFLGVSRVKRSQRIARAKRRRRVNAALPDVFHLL